MSDVKIKGNSVKNLHNYVKVKHSNKYEEWLQNLSAKSHDIFKNIILRTKFYDIQDAYTEPIKILAELCYDGDLDKCAFTIGNSESKKSLGGVYSMFLKIPSLDFIIQKSSSITETYYIGVTSSVEKTPTGAITTLKGFNKEEESMIVNISGWMENLADVISKKNQEVKYSVEDLPDGKIIGKIEVIFEQ